MIPRNYRSSVRKWNAIIAFIKEEQFNNAYNLARTTCGFCTEFFDPKAPVIKRCNKCPLKPEFCISNLYLANQLHPRPIFWTVCDELMLGNKKQSLELAKQMLKEIKKYKPNKQEKLK